MFFSNRPENCPAAGAEHWPIERPAARPAAPGAEGGSRSVRSGQQLAFGFLQRLLPLGVARDGRHRLAIHADGVADAARLAQQIAEVDQRLMAAVAIVLQ